jgi:hypothetical protein
MKSRSISCSIGVRENGVCLMHRTVVLALALLALAVIPAHAQLSGGQHNAATILNSMPPDVLAKVQTLAQMLQQGLKEGTLTNADIQQGMLSGGLAEKLRKLSPEADQLLREISSATQEGAGPGQESILPLLQGLDNQPN